MIRRPPRSTQSRSSAASDVYKRQHQQSDLALVDAARDNPDAFGPLYERHVDRVHAYALKRLRDPDLADDATARAFSRALAGLDRFTPAREQVESGSSFIRWLMTIAL